MKSILLASASIVAFAGAASAQATSGNTLLNPSADATVVSAPTVNVGPVTFGGEAELGFNDVEEDGFFYTADLNVSFKADLGGGLTSTVTFTIPVVEDNTGDSLGSSDYVLALEAEGMGGLYFGDTSFAAEKHWDPGFAMASDDFSEQDNETVLRGDTKVGGFEVSISGVVQDGDGDRPGLNFVPGPTPSPADPYAADSIAQRDFIDQISVGASGNLGMFALDFGYQEESDAIIGPLNADGDRVGIAGVYDSSNNDFTTDEIVALSAGATFGGADLKFGASSNLTADTMSYGVLVRYPLGPVKLEASYTIEPDFDDDSYKVGAEYSNGPITLSAYYQNEVGDEEYGVEAVYKPSDLTSYYIGYIDDTNEGTEVDDSQDEGLYIAARQALSDNAYVEASYAEFGDAGPNEVREGSTLLVGLTF